MDSIHHQVQNSFLLDLDLDFLFLILFPLLLIIYIIVLLIVFLILLKHQPLNSLFHTLNIINFLLVLPSLVDPENPLKVLNFVAFN